MHSKLVVRTRADALTRRAERIAIASNVPLERRTRFDGVYLTSDARCAWLDPHTELLRCVAHRSTVTGVNSVADIVSKIADASLLEEAASKLYRAARGIEFGSGVTIGLDDGARQQRWQKWVNAAGALQQPVIHCA